MELLLSVQTKQDFLHPKWIEKFKEVGIKLTDAYYYWLDIGSNQYKLVTKADLDTLPDSLVTPTYTLPQLLYKLKEWPMWKDKNDEYVTGPLQFLKDAPFYLWYYKDNKNNISYFECASDYPIESAAMLLIQCAKNGIGTVFPIDDKIYGRDSFVY